MAHPSDPEHTALAAGPPCRDFTPKLAAAYNEANKNGKRLEVVFVSSDTDAESQAKYMDEMHADWLRIPYDSPLRQQLKQDYGSFAGKEATNFPGTSRREGIPNVVVIGPDGSEKVFEEGEGSVAIESRGGAVVDDWANFAWPE